ncbi:hypothetical protein FDUTEX481_07732 [Tolypothrix sp. PCC 7601]|nr:hypothetical protein FDUTEX481_07732 [Tolypothrix sp. PCC 7601]
MVDFDDFYVYFMVEKLLSLIKDKYGVKALLYIDNAWLEE